MSCVLVCLKSRNSGCETCLEYLTDEAESPQTCLSICSPIRRLKKGNVHAQLCDGFDCANDIFVKEELLHTKF